MLILLANEVELSHRYVIDTQLRETKERGEERNRIERREEED
jgi:hypothetical protein